MRAVTHRTPDGKTCLVVFLDHLLDFVQDAPLHLVMAEHVAFAHNRRTRSSAQNRFTAVGREVARYLHAFSTHLFDRDRIAFAGWTDGKPDTKGRRDADCRRSPDAELLNCLPHLADSIDFEDLGSTGSSVWSMM